MDDPFIREHIEGLSLLHFELDLLVLKEQLKLIQILSSVFKSFSFRISFHFPFSYWILPVDSVFLIFTQCFNLLYHNYL